MNRSIIKTIAQHECKIAVRNKWLLSFTVLFSCLAVTVILFDVFSYAESGFQGFNRTTASLLNLSLYIMPIIALIFGTSMVTGDIEDGGFNLLTTYPLTRSQIILGKYIGIASSLFAVVALSYGLVGLLLLFFGSSGDFGTYIIFIVSSLLLLFNYLAIAMWIGIRAETRMQAFGLSILVWCFSILMYEFVVIGLVMIMPNQWIIPFLSFSTMINPAEVVRIWTVLALGGESIFGPSYYFLSELKRMGVSHYPLLLASILWVMIPVWLSIAALKRRLS